MPKKIGIGLNIAAMVAGLFSVLALRTFAEPCSAMLTCEMGSQVHMKCFYTGQAIFLLGILLTVVALEKLISQRTGTITYLALTAVLFLLPSDTALGIGVCADSSMNCSTMALLARAVAVICLAVGAAQFFVKGEKEL